MAMDYKQKGAEQLYCMKCGKEIPEKQAFCDRCLEIMEQFPVKPDAHVILPNRNVPSVVKKSPSRKKVLPPEERLAKARKAIQWLSVALIVSIIALCLSVSLLIDTIGSKDPDRAIGQNYSTIDAAKDTD